MAEEKLILEVETKGVKPATADLRNLDAVALAAEGILASLTTTSTALSVAMAVLSGSLINTTAATQAQNLATAAGLASIEANTAATVAQTIALQALTATLIADQSVRAADAVAVNANTAAVAANTTITNANLVATEANVIATEAATVVATANIAATEGQTVASLMEIVALNENSAAVVANTLTKAGNTAASVAATTASTASVAGSQAQAAAYGVASTATAGWTVTLRALMATMAPLIALMTAMLTPIYIFKRLVEGTRTYQDFQAQLEVVTGSVMKAKQAYSALVDYAIQTPYGLKQATDGFVKLVNFGLEPSERAMRALGNIASGTAKEFDQMVQATAMATVNHFVRLKQFGILARKAGDDVIFTFQGVTTKVAANAKAIQGYLLNLGETAFAGAMERRMLSLSGVLSNLGDAWSLFWQAVAKQGADTTITSLFRSVETALKEMTAQLESGQFTASVEAFEVKWRSVGEAVMITWEAIKYTVETGVDFIVAAMQMTGLDWEYIWKYLPIIAEKNLKLASLQLQYWSEMAVIYFDKFVSDFGTAYDQLVGYAKVIGEVFSAVWAFIRAELDPEIAWILRQWDIIGLFAQALGEDLKNIFDAVYEFVSGVATRIVDWFSIKFNELVGYAVVAGKAISDALNLKMPNVSAGFKGIAAAAAVAMSAATVAAQEGIHKVDAALAEVTASSKTRYESAERAATEQAQLAAAALVASNGVVNAAYDKHIAEYNAALKKAEDLRKKYDSDIAARRASGTDRLAEFEKSVNGEGYNAATKSGGRSVREAENSARRELEARLRLIESGMEYENAFTSQKVAESYAEQKRIILEMTEATFTEKEALILAALNESLVTKEQAVRDEYQRRHDIIMEATELTENERTNLIAKLTKARDNKVYDLETETLRKRIDSTKQFFSNIQTIGEAFGKKGFELAKAAAIANITITTAEAAMKAYKDGGAYLGPAFAAMAVAAGGVQIATVSQTQYQGAYAHGGMISSGKYGIAGEAGPELIRGPAVVTSAATTRNTGTSAPVQTVVVHNYGPPVEASSSMSNGQLMIMLRPLLDKTKQETKSEIANDVHRGVGPVTKSLENVYGVNRAGMQKA